MKFRSNTSNKSMLSREEVAAKWLEKAWCKGWDSALDREADFPFFVNADKMLRELDQAKPNRKERK